MLLCLLAARAYAGQNPIDVTQDTAIPATSYVGTTYTPEYTFRNNLPFAVPLTVSINSVSGFSNLQTTNCTPIAANSTCTASASFTPAAAGSYAPEFTLKYGNTTLPLGPQRTTAEAAPDFVIAVDTTAANQHLSLRALTVTNVSDSDQTLTTVTAAPPAELTDKVILCNTTGSNCDSTAYSTTCRPPATLTANGGSCLFWYKAESDNPLQAAESASVIISKGHGLTARNGAAGYANVNARAFCRL
jgi:hypothetical protein